MAPFDNGYSSNLINKLSPLIEGQVPDFIQADHSVFVRFLKHYYQYLESGELRLTVSIDNMLLEVQTESFLLLEDGNKLVLESSEGKFSANETITGGTSKATATVLVDDLGNSTKPRLFISGQQQFQTGETITGGTSSATGTVVRYRANPVQNLQQLLEYANTDNTIYDFLDQLRDSFMNAIPKNLASGLDQRNLIKNIRELYRAKGTSEGHKIFLRMLLGQSSDIMYPNQFMMRVSDGNWGYKNILRCSPGVNSDPSEMVGQVITGQTSGATAVVADALSTAEGTDEISEFELNPASVTGTFVDGETIIGVAINEDVNMSFTVRRMVTSYIVTDGGKLYSAGDDLDLDGQSAIGNGEALAEVGSIKRGSVSRVIIDDVGANYKVGDTITFTTGEGTTTSDPVVKEATGFISVIDGSLAIDGTDSSSTDAGDNLILEDGSTDSFVSIGSIICEDATGTGTQFLILDRSNTSGANVGAHLSLGDQLTPDSHGTENDTFALESGTIKDIDASANIGEIAKVFVKDGGEGYSLLPSVSVTSSLGSSAALLADTDDIGVVDSVNITNQGFKYTVAPEGRFRANFLLKDVSGTFAFGNTLTTSGFTGTVKSFNTTTKVLKTTFEDVERVTMETGSDEGFRIENSLLVQADEPGNTDFFLYTGNDVYPDLDGDGDTVADINIQLEEGVDGGFGNIIMDASDVVGIDRMILEDELGGAFLLQENGKVNPPTTAKARLGFENATTFGGGVLLSESSESDEIRIVLEDSMFTFSSDNSRPDGPGRGFISESMGLPNRKANSPFQWNQWGTPEFNVIQSGDRRIRRNAFLGFQNEGLRGIAFINTDTLGVSRGLIDRSATSTALNRYRRAGLTTTIRPENEFTTLIGVNDKLKGDSTFSVANKSGAVRHLLEDATANVGDKLIGESTGNNIRLEDSLVDFTDGTSFRLLGDSPALSGNIELNRTDSNSVDAGDDIILEDAPDFSSETITITDSGGATGTIVSVDIAKGTSSIGTIAETTAAYSNIESLVGEALNRIQDSVYYQQFAYEVQTGAGTGEYLDELKKAVHPAGFNVFGKVSIATLVSAKLETTGASLGGGYTADTDTFSPILASTFEIIFQEQVSKNHLAITRPIAGYDDKLVLETDNPTGELALEAATASSVAQRNLGINIDPTGRLISETENVIGARILLESSSPDNSLYLILNASDTSGSNDGDRIVSETAESQSYNIALEPSHTLNGGNFLPGGTIPSVSSFLLEDSTANTGDKLELEIDTPNCGRQNSFFTFDVSRNDRVLDEDGANQYLETAGVGYRNSTGERGLVISRVVAKINLPNRNVNSIPTGAVFLGQNTFENELGGISLEIGRIGGGGSGALTLNGFNQLNPLGNVDRVAATGDKLQLQTAADSNVGSGITFKDYGEYANDFIVLNGSDGSSSNAGDNILLEAGTLTDNTHRLKSMTATDVLIGETRLVKSFHKIRDIIRPPRLSVNSHVNGEDFNLVSEESEIGTIQLEDATSSESTRDFLLLEDGVGVGYGNRLSLEKQFLIPEDFTANQNSGVIPTENFTNSDLEPRHYSSDVTKRPLGAISFESTGTGEVHIRLEDGTVGIVASSHRPPSTGFLISDGELVTTGDTTTLTNVGVRMGMEDSIRMSNGEQGLGHGVITLNRAPMGDNNNIGERLIMESATIFDYVENTSALPAAVSNEFSFDNTSNTFDQTGLTFDSTI